MTAPHNDQPNTYQQRVSLLFFRIATVVFIIIMPYLTALPAIFSRPDGGSFFRSFLSPGGIAVVEVPNLLIWVPILVGTFAFRYLRSAVIATLTGVAFPACAYYAISFSTDAQTPIAYLFIPIYSLPFIVMGWLAGFAIDLFFRRRHRALTK